MNKVALWTFRYFRLYVEWFDSEAEAADDAVATEDEGSGSTAGIQFADGTYISRDEWPEYEAAYERRNARWDAEIEAERARPPASMWEVAAPFPHERGRTVTSTRPPDGWPGVAPVGPTTEDA